MLSMLALAIALSSTPLAQAEAPTAGPDAPKPVQAKRLQEEFARSLSFDIQSNSENPLELGFTELASGEWGQPPLAGTAIEPHQTAFYSAGSINPDDALSGIITFLLPYGDTIRIEFEWAPDTSVTCTVDDSELRAVTVAVELEQAMGDQPTCVVLVTDRAVD